MSPETYSQDQLYELVPPSIHNEIKQMNRRFLTISITLGALVCALAVLTFLAFVRPLSAIAPAQPLAGAPNLVSYQGHLTNSSGEPLEGSHNLSFGLYATEVSDTAIWTEPSTAVTVTNGYFTFLLGSITPLNANSFGDTTRWLQVSVDGNALPRQRVTSAPFALQAANADTLDGQHASAFASSSTLGCRVIRTTAQSIPNNTMTALQFDTKIYDTTTTDDCWTDANKTRLYARAAGYYMAGGAVTFFETVVNSAERVAIVVMLNGEATGTALQTNDVHTIAGKSASPSVSTGMFHMNPGDYIELYVWHSFSEAKNTFVDVPRHHVVNGWLMKIN